jgi:membrane protease YdiL (CAAX protease family)
MTAATPIAEPAPRRRLQAVLWALGYLALYGATLWLLSRREQVELGEILPALVLFGGLFSGIAWLLTLRTQPLEITVRRPAAETTVLLGYLVLLVVYLIWGVGPVKALAPTHPAQEFVVLASKLLVWVGLPFVLMRAVGGYTAGELMPVSSRRRDVVTGIVLCVLFILLQLLVGRGLKDMKASGYSAGAIVGAVPLVFGWLVFEVGIVEEFFFRALLQTRISRLLRSEAAGIVIASVLFGLVHAPGFYLRTLASQETVGAHPSILMSAGYAIVVTSAAGIFMAVLWSRTRNFAVVVAVHAAGDLVPGIVPMLDAFLRHR